MVDDIFAFGAAITAIGCFTGIMITWIKYRAGKRLSGGDVTQRLEAIAAQLARLENQTESTAVEIERISEAQRFTTKLLAERTGGGVPHS